MLRREKGRIIIPFRTALKWVVRLRRSPRAIAGGFALGTFIAFTPTFGVQLGIALFMATLMNVNRPAALASVWISNVVTLAPIYTSNYWVGSLFIPGPSVTEVYGTFIGLTAKLVKIDLWEVVEQFNILMGLGREIILPLTLGSIIVGLAAAGLVYLVSIYLILLLLDKRARKRKLD
jgi:uncharacterized protein (DUF2062 family)